MSNVGESTDNVGKTGIGALTVGGSGVTEGDSFCSNMTFTESLAVNSSGSFDGMEITVTNDGGGAGNYFAASSESWTSATGKVSAELTFNSSTDLSSGNIYIALVQGATPICGLYYTTNTNQLNDAVTDGTLATISPTIGEFTIGITLDQAAGTATYSYKLNNATSATANASLTVDGAYSNASATHLVIGSNTPASGVNVVTANSGQADFVTNVDGSGYCTYV